MNVKKWFNDRGPKFIVQRATRIVDRYGFSTQQSTNRIVESMQVMAKYNCAPTFFTPGIVVERYSQFISNLQSEGAEIAVHSYQHIDLGSIETHDAIKQLEKAIQVYEKFGIENHGFRCPYLSCPDELLAALPDGLFDYSSNQAIWIDAPILNNAADQNIIFNTLHRFYSPQPFSKTPSNPTIKPNYLEIPVCIPDDLQIHDGLDFDSDGIAQVWTGMLQQTYQRSALFNLIYHPELSSICQQSFEALLSQARQLQPAVWIARLCDISEWWKEKANFATEVRPESDGFVLDFSCTPRASILARGLGDLESAKNWHGDYLQLTTKTLKLSTKQLPFIGLDSNVPAHTISFLKSQGYIVEIDERASLCGLFIDAEKLASFDNELQIIDYIEGSQAPLIKFGLWPDGAKSALSITGDLDALSLLDYATRLLPL